MIYLTDLEMTKLCADAMGFHRSDDLREQGWFYLRNFCYPNPPYDPLRDDVQAMALVKKIGLDIHCRADMNGWYVGRARLHEGLFINADLNRAIVECVAKMVIPAGDASRYPRPLDYPGIPKRPSEDEAVLFLRERGIKGLIDMLTERAPQAVNDADGCLMITASHALNLVYKAWFSERQFTCATPADLARQIREERRELVEALREVRRILTNLQPHIAQLSKQDQPFIDSHVDMAFECIDAILAKEKP